MFHRLITGLFTARYKAIFVAENQGRVVFRPEIFLLPDICFVHFIHKLTYFLSMFNIDTL